MRPAGGVFPSQRLGGFTLREVLTQLVEVRVEAVRSWDRTHQPGLLEGAPLVDQTPLASDVILESGETFFFFFFLIKR